VGHGDRIVFRWSRVNLRPFSGATPSFRPRDNDAAKSARVPVVRASILRGSADSTLFARRSYVFFFREHRVPVPLSTPIET
jgi:hypothetical protein